MGLREIEELYNSDGDLEELQKGGGKSGKSQNVAYFEEEKG